jgi:hypothetical protein
MIRKPSLADAIIKLRPNSAFILENDDVSQLEWKDSSINPPTLEEIQNELNKLHQDFSNIEYKNLREKEYPNIKDQLDILYHEGYDGWKNRIQEVKDKYPKGIINE